MGYKASGFKSHCEGKALHSGGVVKNSLQYPSTPQNCDLFRVRHEKKDKVQRSD